MSYPYVLRPVEMDGTAAEAELTVAGTVARAVKSNPMGEAEHDPPPVHVASGPTPKRA